MVRVFLCGVGGAGKTTLAEKLTGKKELRRFQRIKEVARKVMEEEQIRKADLERDDRTYLKLQELVMDAQRSEEARCGLDLISDRSVLDSLTYTYMRRGWNYTENLIAQKKVSSTFHQAKEYLSRKYIDHRILWNLRWPCTSAHLWSWFFPGLCLCFLPGEKSKKVFLQVRLSC